MPAGLSLSMTVLLGVVPPPTCKAPTRSSSADYLLNEASPARGSSLGRGQARLQRDRQVYRRPPHLPQEARAASSVPRTDAVSLIRSCFRSGLTTSRQKPVLDSGTFDIMVANQVFHAAVECLPEQAGERTMSISVVATSDVIVITDDGSSEKRARPPNNAMQLTRGGRTRWQRLRRHGHRGPGRGRAPFAADRECSIDIERERDRMRRFGRVCA